MVISEWQLPEMCDAVRKILEMEHDVPNSFLSNLRAALEKARERGLEAMGREEASKLTPEIQRLDEERDSGYRGLYWIVRGYSLILNEPDLVLAAEVLKKELEQGLKFLEGSRDVETARLDRVYGNLLREEGEEGVNEGSEGTGGEVNEDGEEKDRRKEIKEALKLLNLERVVQAARKSNESYKERLHDRSTEVKAPTQVSSRDDLYHLLVTILNLIEALRKTMNPGDLTLAEGIFKVLTETDAKAQARATREKKARKKKERDGEQDGEKDGEKEEEPKD